MKNKHLLLLPLFTLLPFTSSRAQQAHFISDAAYRQRVSQDFQAKQQLLHDKSYFSLFSKHLDTYEREAMEFLYAYMPMGDATDYPADYYLKQVRLSRRIQQEMPWGNTVPEDLFRHFVLPLRVNNENLDEAREQFFNALRNRVRHLSMREAVLEVNHWCHEHVTYAPSDARTSAPLSSFCNALGRCGEESTFLVAALRAVGIPARQVYTPRWAHTDDNHAWVEAWVDGQWHFLGACEPEAVLDHGWFDEAAARGMLMHTKVFGPYKGSEVVIARTPLFTEINLTANYTPVNNVEVQVVDTLGRPIQGARVETRIYNYSEFFPAAAFTTDANGCVTLQAGKGDMVLWVSKNGAYRLAKVSFTTPHKEQIVLGKTYTLPHTEQIMWTPPVPMSKPVQIDETLKQNNERRLAYEDSLRNAYMHTTFFTKETAAQWAAQHQLPHEVEPLLVDAKGNREQITQFLLKAKAQGKTTLTIALLNSLSLKDRRDVQQETLMDHLNHSIQGAWSNDRFYSTILRPRVEDEMIMPYKAYFQREIPKKLQAEIRKNPLRLQEWCLKELTLRPELNYTNIIISPIGVWRGRVADARSRKVFVVAVLRSLGIPAWEDPVTSTVRFVNAQQQEQDMLFNASKQMAEPQGKLVLHYQPNGTIEDPKYYSHFTLSRVQNGLSRLLTYSEGDGGQEAASWNNTFRNGTALSAGTYFLTSGLRQRNGNVPVTATLFNIKEGQTTEVALMLDNNTVTENTEKVKVDVNTSIQTLRKGITTLALKEGEYGVLAVIGVNHEPSNHALKDMARVKQQMEATFAKLTLLFTSEDNAKKYKAEDFAGLPAQVTYGVDVNNHVQQLLAQTLMLHNPQTLPIVIVYDHQGNVIFQTQGYTIGLGEQMVNEVKKAQQP